MGLRRGADWGCARAQTAAAQGRRLGLRGGYSGRAAWGVLSPSLQPASPCLSVHYALILHHLPASSHALAPHKEDVGARLFREGGRAASPQPLVGEFGVAHVLMRHCFRGHVISWPGAHGGGSRLSPPEILECCVCAFVGVGGVVVAVWGGGRSCFGGTCGSFQGR